MTDINLKTLAPDTSLPTTGYLFGADSQASTNPSVYSTQTVATTLLGSTSLTGDVLTASAPVLNLAQTWNNGAVTFTGMKFNVVSDTSAAASLLMDLQVGGTSQFRVAKNGNTRLAGNGYAWVLDTNSTSNTLAFVANGVAGFGAVNSGGFFAPAYQLAATISGAPDTFITWKATRNIQFGQADAATALAQTLSVQSVVAGQTNVAGAAFTITGSQGTGSGAGGSIIFQVAPAGTGGGATVQNTLATALTIGGDRNITGYTNANLFSQNAVNINGNLFGYQVFGFGGNCLFNMSNGNVGLTLSNLMPLSWGPNNSVTDYANLNNPDVKLFRDNSGILAQRNGTNAQEFRVYETTTGTIYKAILGNRQLIKISGAAFDNGAGASAGTMTNAPTAGNPTKWIPIDDNGTTRYIPAW